MNDAKITRPNFLRQLIQFGIRSEMGYLEKRRIKVINIAGIAGGCCAFMFLLANLKAGYTLLCWTDLLAIACGFSMPLFQRAGYYKVPPITAAVVFSLCCSLSAYLYHNHTEFFLLLFMGISFIIWNNFRLSLPLAVFNALMFLLLQINERPALIHDVPWWNKAAVLAICLILYLGFLAYFKRLYGRYTRQIETQNLELQKLNRHNEKLMSVVAHDIRSPIASLHTALSLLKDDMLSRSEFDELSGQLISQVANLEISITSLLGWSKQQLNNPGTNPTDFPLAEVISGILGFLKFQLQQKRVAVQFSGDRNIVLHADRDQVEVILRNLISNAVKFSFPGSTVEIRSTKTIQYQLIEVADSGKGISEVQLAQIFNSTELVSTYGTENEKGTGLGLKLAKEYALLNHGDLWLSSKPGSGTTVYLQLPVASSAE